MPDTSVPGLSDLQGVWRLVSAGRNGRKAPFFVPWLIKVELHVKGDQYTKTSRGSAIESGRIELRERDSFAEIDEHISTGDEAGKSHLGIIRLVGKTLEHLQAEIEDA